MFRFDLSTLDSGDINDTLEAVHQLARTADGQSNNPALLILLGIMVEEAQRRNDGDIGGEIAVELPLAEMTPNHVWCLTQFVCAVVLAASKGEPSAMAQFFARVIDEIEATTKRLASMVNN